MKYIIQNVKALYPRLTETYRFDNRENKSVRADALVEGAHYSVQFEIDAEQDALLTDRVYEVWAAAVKEDEESNKPKGWPETPKYVPVKDIDGKRVGKTSLKGAYNGEATKAPVHVDAKRNYLGEGYKLGHGSIVNLAVTIVAFNTGNVNGISLRLGGVQVVSPKELSNPFGEVEGFDSRAAAAGLDEIPF